MRKQPTQIWQSIKSGFSRYGIKAMSFMALGLFSSLIIGLIISQLGKIPGLGFLADFAAVIGASSPVVGAAIGVAIAYGLGHQPLVIFACAAAGAFGYAEGGPVGAYIAAVVGCEVGGLVAGKTGVDIIVAPMCTILPGCAAGLLVGPWISSLMTGLGQVIMTATELQPLPMGIIVSVVMGMVLTAPISSAALAIMLQLSGPAAGAAVAGCCAQMIGFAVASFRENKWGGLIAQGLGTSMLQVPNILKRPIIWLPPTLASAITGPLAICVFNMQCDPIGAGMGTSGLVGQVSTWATMRTYATPGYTFLSIALIHFILPAILTLAISEAMRKAGLIKPGDMQLSVK